MYKSILFLCLFGLVSCGNEFDEATARQQILELEREQRRVHFEADAASFVQMMTEPHLSVNRGAVSTSTREDNQERFQGYFSSVNFVEWDDLAEPIIRFSADGSLAYCVVQRRVTVQYPSNEGLYHGSTDYAWTAIYRQTGEGWEVESVISTNKEPTFHYLRNVVALADCISPQGPYQTTLKADDQGFLEFHQSYSYREGDFIAQIKGDSLGQSLNNQNVSETLAAETIAMLQGHNFFWMYLQPTQFFDLNTDDPFHREGVDALGNPVQIRRDSHHYQVEQIFLRNPMDTAEQIEIQYLEFDSTAFGPLPLRLDVIQGGKDTFNFHFKEVKFNVEDFPQWLN